MIKDFGLESAQIAIFTSSIDMSNKLKLAQSLTCLKKISFAGDPTILPIPADAPIELPRIILKNEDNSFNLNVSLTRTDLIFKNVTVGDDGVPVSKLEDIQSKLTRGTVEIADILKGGYFAHLNRVGVIAKFIIKLSQSSKKFMFTRFIKSKTLKEPFEINLHLLNKEKMGKFKINEWVKIDSLRSIRDPDDDTALRLVIDINSLAEIDYDLDKKKLIAFLDFSFKLVEKEILSFGKGDGNG